MNRRRLAFRITRGLFLTDTRMSGWGRAWQLLSRFTWELPQTLVGWLYSMGRAVLGRIDRVDTFGGITFVTRSNCGYGMGVSLGSFIDLWTWRDTGLRDEDFVVGDQLCMHEYGHVVDSRRFGFLYLFVIGIPSLMSAYGKGDHRVFWTELRANHHAKRYFAKFPKVRWDDREYPSQKR